MCQNDISFSTTNDDALTKQDILVLYVWLGKF